MLVKLRVAGYMNRGHPVPCNPIQSNLPADLCVPPRLPADRAQGSAGSLTPFRPTHRGGRSTHGPTTVRAASRLSKRPCRLSRATRPRERISIARVARGQRPRQSMSFSHLRNICSRSCIYLIVSGPDEPGLVKAIICERISKSVHL